MWNTALDEAQAGIKISGRNINNLRYADDTTLMAERGTKERLGTYTQWSITQPDWFRIEKEVCQGCILSPCLFNLYAEYIMWHARLDDSQAGIKIAGWNINNLRYADDTTLMAESEEELKNFWMRVKEESKTLA